jgi:hypothetical protein
VGAVTGPAGGFDVRPEELRGVAAALRRDGEDLAAGGSGAVAAARAVAAAAAGDPLASAAAGFVRALEVAVGAVTARVGDAAAGLDTAAGAYVGGDAAASQGLGEVPILGVGGR